VARAIGPAGIPEGKAEAPSVPGYEERYRRLHALPSQIHTGYVILRSIPKRSIYREGCRVWQALKFIRRRAANPPETKFVDTIDIHTPTPIADAL
jgi:hypothetical protein